MDEVTASQAAALTGLSERTIRRKIAAGKINARHIAPNRFAIKLADLPIHRSSDDLVARIEELEHRVRLLELQLRSSRSAVLIAPRAGRGSLAQAPETAVPSSNPGLAELLMQLAHETDRLMPVLSALLGEDNLPLAGGSASQAAEVVEQLQRPSITRRKRASGA